ncbi:carbonic anhydrase family protein [uncultured Stenotrophomonas sp.]|uniref:carbonic anhydrase family protein n=1 Tax=uncultured Stenotrophomonas sp. TaxID=165438 RepID=UPI0028E26396|nr:carbonic anhydrase family protein [uncultured Stenotrophomonas sp.]
MSACNCSSNGDAGRRLFLKTGLSLAALGGVAFSGASSALSLGAISLTRQTRDSLTPDQIVDLLMKGNERFRLGKPKGHQYLEQKKATAAGQYPAAMILSCIDSRAPAEIILDAGIGEVFNARVAGNIINEDMLGSMEFACELAGAKVVLVLGHTACGAVKGAIDGAELENLTGLLQKIEPAVAATRYEGERTSRNAAFVDEVARTNVRMTINDIRQSSRTLSALEERGSIKLVGGLYHLAGGRVELLD